MGLDRAWREVEPGGDFRVGETGGHEGEDVHLAAGDPDRAQCAGNGRVAPAAPRRSPGPLQQVAARAGQLVVAGPLVLGEVAALTP